MDSDSIRNKKQWQDSLQHVHRYYLEKLQKAQKADDPDILAQRHPDDGRKFFDRLLEGLDLSGGLSILDIGCGPGKLLEYLGNRQDTGRIGQYSGIDLLPEFIDEARLRFGAGNISFTCGNFLEMPSEAWEKKPLVLACGVLVHHVEDYEDYVKTFIQRMVSVSDNTVAFNLITDVDPGSENYDFPYIPGKPRPIDRNILKDILEGFEGYSVQWKDHRLFPDATDTFIQIQQV